jgi:3-methylfumaryl-CoA hydratase
MIESNLDPWPVQAMEATLGLPISRSEPPTHLPPLWHWLYFLPTGARSSIGPDGHMLNQEWVDPTLRRRRLFAAARTEFMRPLRIGQRAQMTERVLGRRGQARQKRSFPNRHGGISVFSGRRAVRAGGARHRLSPRPGAGTTRAEGRIRDQGRRRAIHGRSP